MKPTMKEEILKLLMLQENKQVMKQEMYFILLETQVEI
jgi:hypothetical protein